MPCLRHHNNSIPYIIIRSNRIKRMRLEWRSGSARCVAPPIESNREILKFLFKHIGWLSKQFMREQALKANNAYHWPDKIVEGCFIPFMGTQLLLKQGELSDTLVARSGRCLYVSSKIRDNQLEKQVISWLKNEAIRYAQHWSKKIRYNFGLKPRSIVIKDQKSRWGSCGIHDDIYLNWKLMCCPRRVFMYVVVHEHCHLKHRNHGKYFWGLVQRIMPDYKTHDKWLSRYGCLVNS